MTTRNRGYLLSQWQRTRVEEIFGWLKTSPDCPRLAIVASRESLGPSSSLPRPTTW
jgi:hypothetical protein